MKKIPKKVEPPPQLPTPAPDPPAVDVTALIAKSSAAMNEHTTVLVNAMREEMRAMSVLAVESRRGKVRVEIERDRSGHMTALIIERIKAPKAQH